MPKPPTLGRAEIEILRYIADHPGSTVTEVGDYLAQTKGQTRNTALNMMERIRKKGFLRREKRDGVFRYSPSESKGKLLDGLVEDFVDTVLGGSVSPLVAYLGRKVEVDSDQLAELRRLVDELEQEHHDR